MLMLSPKVKGITNTDKHKTLPPPAPNAPQKPKTAFHISHATKTGIPIQVISIRFQKFTTAASECQSSYAAVPGYLCVCFGLVGEGSTTFPLAVDNGERRGRKEKKRKEKKMEMGWVIEMGNFALGCLP
ncbi:hypothetical protein AWENTII_011335 [Aspergillus wentii]